uniref:Metalloendopeptidase n=1 Tax=Ditylenchus dipsaci TaxID=166011 RepID=A0A915E1E1_9BILA
MGQSIAKYSTLHKELQLPSLMVEIFSDHNVDRLEALDRDDYVSEKIHWWPRSSDGEHYVPYRFAKNHFSEEQKEMIRKTMDLINQTTCTKFIPSTRQQHFLTITGKPKGFYAAQGRTLFSIDQIANLDARFEEKHCSHIAHELFHVLGRWHEHQREDRDDHITVFMENVRPDLHIEVQKARGLRPDIEYDHKSVMHYPPQLLDADRNLKTVFEAKNNGKFSTTYQVQSSDLQHINAMYRCDQEYVDKAQRYQAKKE